MKRSPLPFIENVAITDIAAEGKSLARVDEMVVFIPYGAPGDVADVQLIRKRKNFAEGRIVNFKKYSEIRVAPVCQHFTVCGGCKWQHIPYEMQLRHKQQEVADNLTRIGKIALPPVSPIIGSEEVYFYRNKLEFTFCSRAWLTTTSSSDSIAGGGGGGALGFHIPGRYDKALDIEQCYLQDEVSNRIRLFIRQYCIDNAYSYYDVKAHSGLMRNLIIRTSTTGEVMLTVVFSEDYETERRNLLEAVKLAFPEITSLMYVINSKLNDTITDLNVFCYSGKDHLTERMENLQFKIGAKSFFQTNSRQACRLYSEVRRLASLTGVETVYDLYTGTGTIACFLSSRCRKIVGIEYVKEAVDDARVNAALNGIENAEFVAGDMKDLLTAEFIAEHGRPDVIITDPPRSGMHEAVTEAIIAAAPQRIVYVSCNPATQARDLNLLDRAYRVVTVQPVDMFPHTQHVENIVLLETK